MPTPHRSIPRVAARKPDASRVNAILAIRRAHPPVASGMTSDAQLYVGLMSGTSANGIDAALVRFASSDPHAACELLHGHSQPWDASMRSRLLHLGQGGDCTSLDDIGHLDVEIAPCLRRRNARPARRGRRRCQCGARDRLAWPDHPPPAAGPLAIHLATGRRQRHRRAHRHYHGGRLPSPRRRRRRSWRAAAAGAACRAVAFRG